MITKPQLIIFDVNETLLNLGSLESAINSAFQNDSAFENWFSLLLQYSLVETVTSQFNNFSLIGQATLKMVAEIHHLKISDAEISDILGGIKKLPPHPDVIPGLEKLQKAGYKMVSLTNGTMEVAQEQLHFAKIERFFEDNFSVESVRQYKPHPATYQYVLQQMDIPASSAMMVAAHAWDITGAQRAGLQTCFISRPGKVIYPLAQEPQIHTSNLLKAAEKLDKGIY